MAVALETVFPTGVGMFPVSVAHAQGMVRLPHRRGDVSPKTGAPRLDVLSSPQAWGCFRSATAEEGATNVFPTGVGMFPSLCRDSEGRDCLPHRRGDVSAVETHPNGRVLSSPQAWGCFSLLLLWGLE